MKRANWVLLALVVSGCTTDSVTLDLSNLTSGETPTVKPTVLYPNWIELQPGVEFKQLNVGVGASSELLDIVKVDQTQADLQVAVDESNPQTVSAWADMLGATVVVNGSYFDEQYQLVTRTVVDGEASGVLLSGATGLAQQAQADAAWSIVPWAGEAVTGEQALQSYPLLLTASAPLTTSSTATAQRSVLAESADGTLYIIIAEYGTLSLSGLAANLATELDLELVDALNLDGGTSTGLVVASSQVTYVDDSLVVPSVLYILP
jgi:hypothetical protein